MKQQTNLSTKLVGITCALIITSFGVNGLMWWANKKSAQDSAYIENRTMPIVNKAHDAKLAVVQVQQWLTDISATRARDGLNDGFDEAASNAENFRTLIKELATLDRGNAQAYEALLPSFDAYYQTGRRMAQAYIDGGPAQGNQMMAEFDEVAATLTADVDAMLVNVLAEGAVRLSKQSSNVARANTAILFGTGIVLAGIVFLYFTITRVLACLPGILKDLSLLAQGDLSKPVEVTRGDEFGMLQEGLQSMHEQWLKLILATRKSADMLLRTGTEVSDVMAKTSENIHAQQQQARRISQAMSEMNEAVTQVDLHVSGSVSLASGTNSATQEGREVVGDTMHRIRSLSAQIEATATQMNRSSDTSKNVSSVLEVIKDIAEQTNLLALNATIEAARAGEHGHGFAVVAGEVRQLAGQTHDSIDEIHRTIEALQTDVRGSVEAMKASQQHMAQAAERAADADASLVTISESVSIINKTSEQISAASERQNAVADTMQCAIDDVSRLCDETVLLAERSSELGNQWNTTGSELQSMLSRFKIA